MQNSSALLKIRTHPDRVIGLAIFILTAALYGRTTAPTLGGGWDSEEFQHVAYTLSIAHSTGYPLYLILGKIFTLVFPLGNIAYRMNVLSALLGSGVALFIYLITLQLTQRRLASLGATALFVTNPAVWRQSGVASVSSLHLLLVSALLYTLFLWHSRRAPLTLAAFSFGLSLTHHIITLALAPAIGLFVWTCDPGIFRRPRELMKIAFWLVLPLLLYLYLPLRAEASPRYNNTLEGFIGGITGATSADFTRNTLPELGEGLVLVANYLLDSFSYVGAGLILLGLASVVPRWNHWTTALSNPRVPLFLGVATLIFAALGLVYAGESDRYLVLPFFFLVFWFAIGAGAVENLLVRLVQEDRPRPVASAALAIVLAALVIVPFGDRYRLADWSSLDRVYKLWNEIFSLPIPRDATLIGNWSQLNDMRYMQRVENRRADLQFVGALYDPTPQIEAARDALANQRSIFLAPGINPPIGSFRYALLGPLLEVRDAPQMQSPDSIPIPKHIAIDPSLTLVGFGISNALETYKQTESIAPGRTVRAALYWRAEGSVKIFLVRIRLYDPEVRLIAQKDEPPVRGLYPTTQWQRGEYVNDVHNFLIPAGTPPGTYELKMALLDAETKSQMTGEIDLASLTIERATNLSRDQIFIQHPLDIALGHRLSLWGYGGFEGAHRAGETITFNLLWAAHENAGEEVPIYFALMDAAGNSVLAWHRAPIAYYLTREWQKGETLKAYYDLQLPDNLQPGELSFAIGLISKDKPTSLIPIAKIQIVP